MITLLTILIAATCIILMALILIQDPNNGSMRNSNSALHQLIKQSKSSIFLEKITWSVAIMVFVMCIITAVIA